MKHLEQYRVNENNEIWIIKSIILYDKKIEDFMLSSFSKELLTMSVANMVTSLLMKELRNAANNTKTKLEENDG
jgi:hypothetical protein